MKKNKIDWQEFTINGYLSSVYFYAKNKPEIPENIIIEFYTKKIRKLLKI